MLGDQSPLIFAAVQSMEGLPKKQKRFFFTMKPNKLCSRRKTAKNKKIKKCRKQNVLRTLKGNKKKKTLSHALNIETVQKYSSFFVALGKLFFFPPTLLGP